MQPHRFRKTDGLAHQSLQPGPEGEVLPFNLLRRSFANRMLFRLKMTTVHVCTISIDMPNAQRGEPCFSWEEDVVRMGSQHVGYETSRAMVNGMPEPPLLGFLPHNTPQLIDFCFFHWLDLNHELSWIDGLDGRVIDVRELRRFFLMLQ